MFRKKKNPSTYTAPIDIVEGTTLPELVNLVEASRQKPMRVLEVPELAASGSLCGLWLSTENEDLVLHAPSDSSLHREQFILHELAHMMLRHDRSPHRDVTGVTGADSDRRRKVESIGGLAEMFTGSIEKVMAREDFLEKEELDAEALADSLAARLRRKRRSPFSRIFG